MKQSHLQSPFLHHESPPLIFFKLFNKIDSLIFEVRLLQWETYFKRGWDTYFFWEEIFHQYLAWRNKNIFYRRSPNFKQFHKLKFGLYNHLNILISDKLLCSNSIFLNFLPSWVILKLMFSTSRGLETQCEGLRYNKSKSRHFCVENIGTERYKSMYQYQKGVRNYRHLWIFELPMRGQVRLLI